MFDVHLFLSDLFAHHWAWVGGILTIIGLAEKIWNKAIVVPRWVIWFLALVLLFVASCQSWLDEHRNVETLINEKSSCYSGWNSAKFEIKGKDGMIQGLQGTVAKCLVQLSSVERPVKLQWKGFSAIVGNKNQGLAETISVIQPNLSVSPPINLKVVFDGPILSSPRVLLANTVGAAMFGGSKWTNDQHGELDFSISAPGLTSASPVFIIFDTDRRINILSITMH